MTTTCNICLPPLSFLLWRFVQVVHVNQRWYWVTFLRMNVPELLRFSLLEGNCRLPAATQAIPCLVSKGDIFLLEQHQKHLPRQNVAVTTTTADFLGLREPLPDLEKICINSSVGLSGRIILRMRNKNVEVSLVTWNCLSMQVLSPAFHEKIKQQQVKLSIFLWRVQCVRAVMCQIEESGFA